MDRLTSMEIFARVVETTSFTAAAEQLGLSRAAASKRIQQLEADLGARLLNRSTRQVAPTEVGRAFYERCLRVLSEASDAEEFVRQLQDEPTGRLRISASQSFGAMHLGPALSKFLKRYPEIEISVSLNDRIVSLFEENSDVAFRISRTVSPNLTGHRISPIKICLVCSPGYVAENGAPQRPEDLTKHSCLHYGNLVTGNTWAMREATGEKRIPIVSRFQSNNGDILMEAAMAGLGITILPRFMVWSALAEGDLVTVLDDCGPPDLSLFAVYPSSSPPSAKIRMLVDFLSEQFGPEPYWDNPPKSTRRVAVPPA